MPTTWEPASVAAVTLSGGNLVATNTGTTATNQGAHGLTTDGQTTGKFYFEATWTICTSGVSSNHGIGIGTPASTYPNMGNGGTTGVIIYHSSSVYSNGSIVSGVTVGPGSSTWKSGDTIGVATDLTNRRIWFRVAPSGFWNSNSNAANDPATNVGGVTIPAGAMVPFITFGGTAGTSSNVFTANFGASAFTGAVPAGFIAGFPDAATGATQARAMVLA